ncbi:MAG TPA: MlaD family protein [Solirubrobacteraceae bacterium]|nr:MlaD family protein [Solirubrobacteraceae bacterium]
MDTERATTLPDSPSIAAPARTPQRRRPRRRPVKRVPLGLLAVLLVIVGVYFVFHKRLPFSSRWTLHAIVSNTSNLVPGSPVREAGVTVGSVTGTSRGPGQSGQVTMVIDTQGRPIHTDATILIRPRLFLEGGFYVQLDPGSPSAPVIEDGGTLPQADTARPVQFYTVLSTLTQPIRASLTDALHAFAVGLHGTAPEQFNHALKQFAPTLEDAAYATQASQGTEPNDVSRLIASASAAARTLANSDQQLGQTIDGVDDVAHTLAIEHSNLAATLPALDGTLKAAPAAFTALDSTLPQLRRFSTALRPALEQAPPVLRAAVPALDQLRLLVAPGALPRLIDELQPLALALPALYRQLDTLFPSVRATVRCVASPVLPVLNSKVPDGHLSTDESLAADFEHDGVAFGGDAVSYDANGYGVRDALSVGPYSLDFGTLQGTTDQIVGSNTMPILGERPQWNGSGGGPTYRPDVPCNTQAVPNLAADNGTSDENAGLGSQTVHLKSGWLTSFMSNPHNFGERR